MSGTASDTAIELIAFELFDQEFCIDISAVREIRGWTPATPMPEAPEHICGLINLRGTIMPVVDLGRRLGLGASSPSPRHVIVVVQKDDKAAGLLVDAVQETFSIAPDSLHRKPDLGDRGPSLVDGIISMTDRLRSRIVVDLLIPGADGPPPQGPSRDEKRHHYL
jgi:purine-binding chemotaxis protein CheW